MAASEFCLQWSRAQYLGLSAQGSRKLSFEEEEEEPRSLLEMCLIVVRKGLECLARGLEARSWIKLVGFREEVRSI